MKHPVVVGLQYGDEGKGKVTDLLAQEADWVIRFNGGSNAGHTIWLNVNDARARGVKDGDHVAIENDKGKAVMTAYVTSRVMPGLVVVHHGGWYQPDGQGVDWGATPNVFLTDNESPVTAPLVTNLVQVARYQGPIPSTNGSHA